VVDVKPGGQRRAAIQLIANRIGIPCPAQ
jgi:hypothetical protein